jgi:hypothetical protein
MTKTLSVPQLTTLERDALVSPAQGTEIYNTDTNELEVYNGSSWVGGSSGSVSLQLAYDGGATIDMQAGVNLEVKTSGGDAALEVFETNNTVQVQNLVSRGIAVSALRVQTDSTQSIPAALLEKVDNLGPATNSQVIYEKDVNGINTGSGLVTYGKEEYVAEDTTLGSERGQVKFYCMENGVITEYFRLEGAANQVSIFKTLDMQGQNIVALATAQAGAGYIDFSNLISPTAFEIKANGAQDLSLDTTTGNIVVGQKVRYVQAGQVPSTIDANTTYIFLGDRTITTPIVINQPGVVFKGTGRDNSSITMTGSYVGGMIQVFDQDFEIADINLSAQGDNTYAIYGFNIDVANPFNAGRTKTLNITNCQFRNCINGMLVEGFDLVDVSQTLFYYFQAPSVVQPQFGINLLGCSKVEFTSCEFLRWYDESTNPTPANFFEGNMFLLQNHPSGVGFGAVNLATLIVHPQQNQNGVVIDPAATFGFANLTGSTFVDGNLNLPTYQPLVIDIDTQPSWIVEANQNVPNLVAFVNAEVDANALVTTISAVSTPTPFAATTFVDNGLSRLTLNSSTGVITKDSKRPNFFSINLTGQLTIQAGGNNQDLEIGLLRNGVPDGPTAKLQADSAVPATFSYNVIGFAVQNDTFQVYVQNNTGTNDILLNNLQLAGVEA